MRRWRIRVLSEGSPLLDRVLPEGVELVLGRTQNVPLQVREQSISRKHCAVRVHEDGVELRDLGSANGIRVGNDRLREAHLREGETAWLGNVEIVATQAEDAGGPETTTLGSPVISADSESRARPVLDPRNPDARYGQLESNRLAVLVEASKSLASVSDLQELFGRILDHVFEILEVKRAVIALREEDGSLRPAAVRPTADDLELSSICSQSILRRVVTSGEASLIEDALKDVELAAGQSIMAARIRAALAAPLSSQNGVLGVLYVDFPGRARLYNAEDLNFLALFAGICGVAVENAEVQTLLRTQERIQRDFEIARDIQHALLPLRDMDHPLIDLDWKYRPCRQVGGDFYDHILLDDGRVCFVLGDVSGKGMPAALRMVRVTSIFRAAMGDSESPAEVLGRVNRFLQDPQHDLARESGWFATAFCGLLNPRDGTLVYAAAGHTGLLLRGGGGFEHLTATGVPLRVMAEATFAEHEVPLEMGGVLALFTDGLTETSQKLDQQFGEERIKQLLKVHQGAGSRTIVRRILEAIDQHVGDGGPRMDDMALLVVQRKPGLG